LENGENKMYGAKEADLNPHIFIIKRKNPLPEKMGSEQLNVVQFFGE
jgi:hypothetical protein